MGFGREPTFLLPVCPDDEALVDCLISRNQFGFKDKPQVNRNNPEPRMGLTAHVKSSLPRWRCDQDERRLLARERQNADGANEPRPTAGLAGGFSGPLLCLCLRNANET